MGCAARISPQLALNALPNHIAGVDNDPGAVWLANVLLASEMLPILARAEQARRRPLPALVHLGDGLAPRPEPVRAVIMNPPYGRTRLDAAERERFDSAVYGHANLYGLFMAAALENLDDQGVLSALVPTSFLAGRYFAKLRRLLVNTTPLREIGFVADRSGSFTGVLQETSLATFTRRKARRVTVNSLQVESVEVAVVASPRTEAPWLLPRRADDAPVAAAAQKLPLRLGDAGWRVSTGPLVWNRRKEDLGARKAAGRVRVMWAADIDGGVIHQDRARNALRWLTVRGTDENFMVLREPAVLVQRTTAPEQNRRLVAAYLDTDTLAAWGGAVVVENHVNVVRTEEEEPLVSARTLARLLSTDTLDRVLRCLSGSVAVSAYELAALPLPGADTLRELDTLDDHEFERRVAAAYSPAQR
jgi:adenine-specific DNA-methyltransferase